MGTRAGAVQNHSLDTPSSRQAEDSAPRTIYAAPVGVGVDMSTVEPDAQTAAGEALVTLLAHELNNHLIALSLLLRHLRGRAVAERRADDRRDCELALLLAQRLSAIVADALETARLREGMMTLLYNDLDLTALVEECAALFDTGDHLITVAVPSARQVMIAGDARRLRQAIENLLANALKYSSHGTPIQVTLEIERKTPSGADNVVRVSVTDHGTGIAPDLLPRIFDRFVVGPKSQSLGVGLYLARSIARMHGGDLIVSSVFGAGACFSLTLPLTAAT
jgi:signal transduction histidine kinase